MASSYRHIHISAEGDPPAAEGCSAWIHISVTGGHARQADIEHRIRLADILKTWIEDATEGWGDALELPIIIDSSPTSRLTGAPRSKGPARGTPRGRTGR